MAKKSAVYPRSASPCSADLNCMVEPFINSMTKSVELLVFIIFVDMPFFMTFLRENPPF